jgi:hypothetical protein
MVAALFVATGGVYFGMPDVDPWDCRRDARLYDGPYPVVAHPPCERWGRYWGGGPMLHGTPRQKKLGDDGGCFAAALSAVRRFGGVLEHPEASHAWKHHGLWTPPKGGTWVPAGDGGWTCCVEQGHYGHAARKATWLYVSDPALVPRHEDMKWGPSHARTRADEGFHSREERKAARDAGIAPRQRLSKRQLIDTPLPFRDLLLSIARSAYARREAA